MLVLVLGRSGILVAMKISRGSGPSLVGNVNWKKIIFVTVTLLIIFTSRCLYDFVSGAGYFSINVTDSSATEKIIVFSTFFVWEIIPPLLTIFLFGKIIPTKLGAFSFSKRGPINVKGIDYQRVDINSMENRPILKNQNLGVGQKNSPFGFHTFSSSPLPEALGIPKS